MTRRHAVARWLGPCVAAVCVASATAGESPGESAATPPVAEAAAEQAEVRRLMNYCFALARQILAEHPAFHPFAFVLEQDGQVAQVALSEGRDHEGAFLIETLEDLLQQRASEGKYRAIGIAADVHIAHDGKETDAIQVGLEHTSGYCVHVYLPYERSEDGEVSVGEAVSAARTGTVFGPCTETAGD